MWVEKLARFGYAAKGVVYAIVGILAVMAAFSAGGKTTGTKGALQTIAAQPFGQFLLVLVAIGLCGYVLWRFVEAIKDPDNKGTDAKGIAARLGYVGSGILYAGLAFNAALLAMGSSQGGGSGDSTQDWTAKVMQQPFGRWLVGIGGAIAIGVGFYMLYKAYSVKFRKKLNLSELNLEQEKWAVRISRFGLAAKGVVLTMIGFFLLQAAYQYDPSEARGLDGALQTLAQQPFGKFLLGIVALGLVAYGIYMWVEARYRRIRTT
ncbi:DUF1206 domain-containing protein [Oscillatoria salina]|uniref:DUF1206 domain-containing protein n=1 Tax=Oscillatoria salina TaxID=331517 RepID=UPI0013B707E9|nr:DUF1206 domain-containing protein [Oscillatoria salina]MBZ8180437.1 DUF1206 domain-containing protein [Oscillatoria salina IIICB1]NET89469.1 DUF1206 domain-containing protein [Kamptonema sp. SIO1D9]